MENRKNNHTEYSIPIELTEADQKTLMNLNTQLEKIAKWIFLYFRPKYKELAISINEQASEETINRLKTELKSIVEDSVIGEPIFSFSNEETEKKFFEFCNGRDVNIKHMHLVADLQDYKYLNYPTFKITDWIEEVSKARIAVQNFLNINLNKE